MDTLKIFLAPEKPEASRNPLQVLCCETEGFLASRGALGHVNLILGDLDISYLVVTAHVFRKQPLPFFCGSHFTTKHLAFLTVHGPAQPPCYISARVKRQSQTEWPACLRLRRADQEDVTLRSETMFWGCFRKQKHLKMIRINFNGLYRTSTSMIFLLRTYILISQIEVSRILKPWRNMRTIGHLCRWHNFFKCFGSLMDPDSIFDIPNLISWIPLGGG